jgi:hypothetical protein
MPAGAGASRKAAEPRGAAAVDAATAAAREQARARRRRRATKRDHSDRFMTMGVEVDPDWGLPDDEPVVAADRGAGPVGFAGNAVKERITPVGMTRRQVSALGSGPQEPMVPASWGAGDSNSQ